LTRNVYPFVLLFAYINFAVADIVFVPEMYESIHRAISKCGAGDTVLVAPGIYERTNLNLGDKPLTLASTFIFTNDVNDIYDTELRGDQVRSVISVYKGGENNINIIGFTISAGFSTYGGGMDIRDSNPLLKHLVITGNACGSGGGGAIFARGSSPVIENCLIGGNSSGDVGGGYYGKNSSNAVLRNVVFAGNAGTTLGGAVYLRDRSQTLFENVIFLNNQAMRGSAVALKYDNHAVLDKCLVIGGDRTSSSIIYSGLRSTSTVLGSTLRDFESNAYSGIWFEDVEGGVTRLHHSLKPGERSDAISKIYHYERIASHGKIDFLVSATDTMGQVGYPNDIDSNPLLQSFRFDGFEKLSNWAFQQLDFGEKVRKRNVEANRMLRAGEDHYVVERKLKKITPIQKNPGDDSASKYTSTFSEVDRRRIDKVSVEANYGKNFDALLEGYLRAGNIKAVSLMIEKNPMLERYIRLSDKRGYKSPLELAIGAQNIPLINLLIKKGASRDKGLAAAASQSDTTILEMFLHDGANVNACMGFNPENYDCFTAISAASKVGNLGMVKYLLRKGARPSDGIMEACENKNYEVAKLLLQRGASANTWRDEQSSLFARMVGKEDVEAVRLLLEFGADPNPQSVSKFDINPMELAEEIGNQEIYQMIKTNIRDRAGSGQNPTQDMLDAVVTGDYGLLAELVRVVDFAQNQLMSENPLMRAISIQDTTAMKIILKAGAPLNAGGHYEQDVIRLVMRFRDPSVFKCLLDYSPILMSDHSSDLYLSLELAYQTLLRNEVKVAQLLQEGAPAHVSDTYSDSPLLIAVEENHVGISYLLLENGALTQSNIQGNAALNIALEKNYFTQFELLTEAGVRHTERNITYYFCEAIEDKKDHIARTMIGAEYPLGADVNSSPLVAAIEADNAALVGLLLAAGADPNEKPERQYLPLFEAIHGGNPAIIKLLLLFGADRHSTDKYGDTAIEEARADRRNDIVKILQSYDPEQWVGLKN